MASVLRQILRINSGFFITEDADSPNYCVKFPVADAMTVDEVSKKATDLIVGHENECFAEEGFILGLAAKFTDGLEFEAGDTKVMEIEGFAEGATFIALTEGGNAEYFGGDGVSDVGDDWITIEEAASGEVTEEVTEGEPEAAEAALEEEPAE